MPEEDRQMVPLGQPDPTNNSLDFSERRGGLKESETSFGSVKPASQEGLAPAWWVAVNVGLLSVCFGIGWAVLFIQVGTSTVAAKDWAGTAAGTVPYGLLAGTHALFALPCRMLMQRLGARPGYIFGALMGAAGNAVHILAASRRSFLLLCLGAPLCGLANAYANFLRFEATQFVPASRVPWAISCVVAGGVLGGGMGPVVSRLTKHLIGREFEGTYLVATCMWILQGLLVGLVAFKPPLPRKQKAPSVPPPVLSVSGPCQDQEQGGNTGETGNVLNINTGHKRGLFDTSSQLQDHQLSTEEGKQAQAGRVATGQARPLVKICRQPQFVVAVVAGVVSYSSMATIMLAALLAMKAVQPGGKVVLDAPDGGVYTFDDTSNAILIHVEAMFFPSFFTSLIISALGVEATLAVGFVIMLAGEFVLLFGSQLWVFFLSLVLVGLGWNLTFVGASALVAASHGPLEKDKAQGLNDCIVFGINTLVTASSSAILKALNSWRSFVILYASLTTPALLVAAGYWVWVRKRAFNQRPQN